MTAGNDSLVYLPLTFYTETQAIRTSICLEVTEHLNPSSRWWESSGASGNASERAFKALLASIKRKDLNALFELCDPTVGRDPQGFNDQATALFQQLEKVQVVAVPRAYEFDGFVVFFAQIHFKGKSFCAPFIFKYKKNGSLGFLPRRTDNLTFLLVNDWFNESGGSFTDKPAYCSNTEIHRATHQISLMTSSDTSETTLRHSRLFLTGASVDVSGKLSSLAKKVEVTIAEMKSALDSGEVEGFIRYLTPEGGNRLKNWFSRANEPDRSTYKKSIIEQHPFFVFDASPLVVVYTYVMSSGRRVEVMYFTYNSNNELLWTNSSYVTVADRIFKRGPLYEAALLSKPFSGIEIK